MPPECESVLTVVAPAGNLEKPVSIDYSLGVQEVLGRTPPRLLRSGRNVVAIAVSLLLFLSWIIHYPDTIEGKTTITGANPSVAVVARESGRLDWLYVKEGERVSKGHLLGVITNPANTEQMLQLKDELQKLQSFLADSVPFTSLDLSDEAQLGAVQVAYGEFHTRYRQYEALLRDDYADRMAELLQRQLDRKHMEATRIEQEKAATERETVLAQENLDRMTKLHNKRATSTQELQIQERQLLEQKKQRALADKEILAHEITSADYEKQIRDIFHKRSEDLRLARNDLIESLKKLLAGIDIWENDFVLRAPTAGVVAFYDFWTTSSSSRKGSRSLSLRRKPRSCSGACRWNKAERERSGRVRFCGSNLTTIHLRNSGWLPAR